MAISKYKKLEKYSKGHDYFLHLAVSNDVVMNLMKNYQNL